VDFFEPGAIATASLAQFRQGMRELGYIEGKNFTIELRFAEEKPRLLPSLAAELVQLKVDAIVAVSLPAASAAQKATTTIPIVFGGIGDPVGRGLVKSLAHPGGNITGVSNMAADVVSKHLEMLLDVAPKITRVAFLLNPTNSGGSALLKIVETVAQKVRVEVLPLEARTPDEIEKTFSEMARQKAGGLIVVRDPFLNRQLRQIAELAAKNRIPAIAGIREYVEAGGLMSYGSSLEAMWRRVATYVDKIFKGANPADIPVEQPTKFELFINGKTAKALGLKIPQTLLIRADRVIE
jgi:putative ABC transport system substrate-binding protein